MVSQSSAACTPRIPTNKKLMATNNIIHEWQQIKKRMATNKFVAIRKSIRWYWWIIIMKQIKAIVKIMKPISGQNKQEVLMSLRLDFLSVLSAKKSGENINLNMVEEGLAIARFQEGEKYKEEIVNAERFARENKVGCKWRE